jgi:1,4-dihydroxy-2-naphthoyl-CoA hydrolase
VAEPADQRPGDGLSALLEVQPVEIDDGQARARLAVRDELTGPDGATVATGVYAGLAETICVAATRAAIGPDADAVQVLTTQTSVLAPAGGEIEAMATARHRGRTTWVWDVEFRHGGGELCASTRLTLAIRPQPR